MAKSNLVIVESPAKAKTIGKYLGPDYQVLASMGHVRDLPKSKMGVDLESGDFTPNYQPIPGKEEVIEELKDAADHSQKVYLATDPDREGGGHFLALEGTAGPARREDQPGDFLTRSPKRWSPRASPPPGTSTRTWWTPSRPGGSWTGSWAMSSPPAVEEDPPGPVRRAGAVRGHPVGGRAGGGDPGLCPQEYWTLEVTLNRVAPNQGSFKTQFYGREKKMELKSQADVDQVLSAIRTAPFSVSKIKRQDKNRAPAPPSSPPPLQQEASRKLNMTPPADHVHRPAALRRRGHRGGGDRGSHHLHAYRLPPSVGRGSGGGPGLCRGPVRPGVFARGAPPV